MEQSSRTTFQVGDIVRWALDRDGYPPLMLRVRRGHGPFRITAVRTAPTYWCNCRDYGHEFKPYVRGHCDRCRSRESPSLRHHQEVRIASIATGLEFVSGNEPKRRLGESVYWLSAAVVELTRRGSDPAPGEQGTFPFA